MKYSLNVFAGFGAGWGKEETEIVSFAACTYAEKTAAGTCRRLSVCCLCLWKKGSLCGRSCVNGFVAYTALRVSYPTEFPFLAKNFHLIRVESPVDAVPGGSVHKRR